jgi:hypothetical protein
MMGSSYASSTPTERMTDDSYDSYVKVNLIDGANKKAFDSKKDDFYLGNLDFVLFLLNLSKLTNLFFKDNLLNDNHDSLNNHFVQSKLDVSPLQAPTNVSNSILKPSNKSVDDNNNNKNTTSGRYFKFKFSKIRLASKMHVVIIGKFQLNFISIRLVI